MNERTILAISAGLSKPSTTTLLATRLTAKTATELQYLGVLSHTRVIELREHAHAITDAMLTGFAGESLAPLLEDISRADGLVLVSPLYTTTFSGLFKSFLDIIDPDALAAMPVLLGATGGTARHSLALEYGIRPMFTYLRADVVPTAVFAATDDWAAAASEDEALEQRIARAATQFAAKVSARPNPGPADPFTTTPSFGELLGK